MRNAVVSNLLKFWKLRVWGREGRGRSIRHLLLRRAESGELKLLYRFHIIGECWRLLNVSQCLLFPYFIIESSVFSEAQVYLESLASSARNTGQITEFWLSRKDVYSFQPMSVEDQVSLSLGLLLKG